MNAAGIIAEYNPFHTGHAYQIRQTRAALGPDAAIVAVMSGNWVQQADCAIAGKWTRTRLALTGGADLVLELPTVWATASAEGFARGAVELLSAAGVVEHLCFGSECGDVDALRAVAAALDSESYPLQLRRQLDRGLPFAAARQQAVQALLGDGAQALSSPNNNLGVEYIRALNALGSPIRPMTVARRGAAHNSVAPDGSPFVSATQLRLELAAGNWARAEAYLPPGGRSILEQEPGLARLERIERAMLARVRTMTAEDWSRLPDCGAREGLPQLLEKAGRQCRSMEEFFLLAKSKRYTHARLRRLALRAFLGLEAAQLPPHPCYLRVLGFNARGREVLKEMKTRAALPVITKPAHARALDGQGCALFALEARCTDLYDLCLDAVPTPGREWTTGPVIFPAP